LVGGAIGNILARFGYHQRQPEDFGGDLLDGGGLRAAAYQDAPGGSDALGYERGEAVR
jgi:hypothetical protein